MIQRIKLLLKYRKYDVLSKLTALALFIKLIFLPGEVHPALSVGLLFLYGVLVWLSVHFDSYPVRSTTPGSPKTS